MPSGRFVFHRIQQGTYTAAGDKLELKPEKSTRIRKMPEDPAGDYPEVPEPLETRAFTFRADLDSLHLHESGRYALVLLRAT
ncbi:hypothetical protein [Lentzea pudingi]|uniref:hypothetical protein n=1 Tax=Lentzea pudingi TaxID=1789439 RepID=UPI0016663D9A|nr:hypothetical protein [Lentzea pudingi]